MLWGVCRAGRSDGSSGRLSDRPGPVPAPVARNCALYGGHQCQLCLFRLFSVDSASDVVSVPLRHPVVCCQGRLEARRVRTHVYAASNRDDDDLSKYAKRQAEDVARRAQQGKSTCLCLSSVSFRRHQPSIFG